MVAPAQRFNVSAVPARTGPRRRESGTTEAFPSTGPARTMSPMAYPAIRRTTVAVAVLVLGAMVAPVGVFAATDSDHDGLPNTWERSFSLTSPYRSDTDRDGIPDGK